MKRKNLACLLMLAMLLNACACAFAEEAMEIEIIRGENDPDFSTLTVDEWLNYEFNQDYAAVISNVTSYDHEFLRSFLDKHWAKYLALAMPPEARGMTDAEQRALLAEHYNMRVSALADADTVESNRIYLWPKGQVSTVTEDTENTGYAYADWPDFEPFMLPMLVDEGVTPKGAVILCAGGSRIFRSNIEESYEVALALNARGYQCFIVNYRLTPYTMAESALDFARAVRYVRANAEKYGVQENNIACAGFSAGGSVISAALAEYVEVYANEEVWFTQVDASYFANYPEMDAVFGSGGGVLSVYPTIVQANLTDKVKLISTGMLYDDDTIAAIENGNIVLASTSSIEQLLYPVTLIFNAVQGKTYPDLPAVPETRCCGIICFRSSEDIAAVKNHSYLYANSYDEFDRLMVSSI